ncbi:hypothetical protein ACQ4PT_001024 [Festuca glaucescens]
MSTATAGEKMAPCVSWSWNSGERRTWTSLGNGYGKRRWGGEGGDVAGEGRSGGIGGGGLGWLSDARARRGRRGRRLLNFSHSLSQILRREAGARRRPLDIHRGAFTTRELWMVVFKKDKKQGSTCDDVAVIEELIAKLEDISKRLPSGFHMDPIQFEKLYEELMVLHNKVGAEYGLDIGSCDKGNGYDDMSDEDLSEPYEDQWNTVTPLGYLDVGQTG